MIWLWATIYFSIGAVTAVVFLVENWGDPECENKELVKQAPIGIFGWPLIVLVSGYLFLRDTVDEFRFGPRR